MAELAFCIASGPSLTKDDCELVRSHAKAKSAPVIVTNSTFLLCPWADYLFAYDRQWLAVYRKELAAFPGRIVSPSTHAVTLSGMRVEKTRFPGFGNSGAGAISLAHHLGAKRILLLGYDCQRGKADRKHWHDDHPKPLGNAGSMPKWPDQFAKLATHVAGVEVVNCSRETGLKVFPRMDLESAVAATA